MHKWSIPDLKWYEKLYMNLTPTDVKVTAKHVVYTKMLGKRKFVDRYKKGIENE